GAVRWVGPTPGGRFPLPISSVENPCLQLTRRDGPRDEVGDSDKNKNWRRISASPKPESNGTHYQRCRLFAQRFTKLGNPRARLPRKVRLESAAPFSKIDTMRMIDN